MKKTIILTLAVTLSALSNYSLASDIDDPSPIADGPRITTLIIDADVRVVLVDNIRTTLEISGNKSLKELVRFSRKADTLVIGSLKKRNLIGAGIIFVPASYLRNIRINSNADVRSLYMLSVPKLDVIINGRCEFAISSVGQLNFHGTEHYSFEHSTEVRPAPADIIASKAY